MCLEETAHQRNIFVQGKNEEKKTFHKLFFGGAPAFFNLLVDRQKWYSHFHTENSPQKGEYCYCVCIYFNRETFPINFLNYICTSTTIYQIYFGESPSTYKNNTDWTCVV